jgi:hypothetical protein
MKLTALQYICMISVVGYTFMVFGMAIWSVLRAMFGRPPDITPSPPPTQHKHRDSEI